MDGKAYKLATRKEANPRISGAAGVSGGGADAIFGPIRAPHARTIANDFLREQKRYLGL